MTRSRLSFGVCGRVAAALLAAAILGSAGLAARQERLLPGATLEDEIKGGEVRAYEVDLTAGTWFAVRFDQQGIDIRPAIVGPDGATIFDCDTREWGMEPAFIVAPATGRYRLEARTLDKQAPRGRYVLHVDAIRPASPEDEAQWRVMQVHLRAYATLQPRTRESAERARALFAQALDGWRAVGNRPAEADAVTALAFIQNWMDEFTAADQYDVRDVEIRRELHDEYGEARALRNLGMRLRVTGETAEAIDCFERALALHRAARRPANESEVLGMLANTARTGGDYGAALDYAYEAIALARRIGDPAREANALLAAGPIHLDLGELDLAADVYRRARALVPGDETVRGIAATQIGLALVRAGQRDEAERSLNDALAFWSKRQWGGYLGNTLSAFGELHLLDGDLVGARDAFERAAAVSAQTGFARGEAVARRKAGEVLLRLGRLDEAERALAAAMARLDSRPDPIDASVITAGQARVALARHDLGSAHRLSEEAVRMVESVRGRAEGVRLRTAMLASSQDMYSALVDVLMAEHAASPSAGFDRQALEVSERARARSLLELVSGDRVGPNGPDTAPLAKLRPLQRRITAKAQALDDARRGGSKERIESIRREIDALTREYGAAEERLRREHPDAMAVGAPQPLSANAIQRDLLDADTVLVEYALGESQSHAWTVSRDAVVSYRLAPRSEMVEAARQARDAFAVVPGTARRARAARSPEAAASRIGSLLLAPIEHVPAGKRLVIVAPGDLQQLPFAALTVGTPRVPLIARHEIVLAPSASIVAAVRRSHAGRPRAPRAVAVFADPVFDATDPRVASARASASDRGEAHVVAAASASHMPGDRLRAGLARLPFSRMEADAIASMAPSASVLKATDFNASVRTATAPALAGYRIVHFATHGVLDTRTPELSGLVLSLVDRTGRPQDGFIRLFDLDRMRLNAEVAVLSGCETALGRSVDGEGVIGLTRGFLAAGAQRVVASVWKVDDLATAELMKRFYRGMLQEHKSPSAALRAAQRQLARSPRWSAPYYWAGWVIQGEWR